MQQKNSAVVQASEIFYECLDCGEAIDNPICPECIAKEIEQWLNQYPKVKRKVMPVIERFLKAHKKFTADSQICVHCYRKSAYVCPYCFTDFVYELLKEIASEKILEEYKDFFNFDFGCFEGHWRNHDAL